MSSSASEEVAQDTTNLALDKRVTMDSGTAIVDSIINSNDPAVVSAALAPTLAAWQQMLASGNLNLIEVVGMGNTLIDQIDKSQIKIANAQEKQLRAGVEMFETMVKTNKLNVQLVDSIASRASDQSDKALDIVASVKTGDFATLSTTVMAFALLAMWISKK